MDTIGSDSTRTFKPSNINPMQSWLGFLNTLSRKALHQGHRQVIILAGEASWAWRKIENQLKIGEENSIISENMPSFIHGNRLKSSKPNNLLGYESDNIVFNCHDGLFPDALTAISGTLKAGGIFFVLCPKLHDWPNFSDTFSKKRASYSDTPEIINSSQMVQRLLAKAKQHTCYVIEQINETVPEISTELNHPKNAAWALPTALTHDQNSVFTRICHGFSEHSHFCHVISADRGRGKSYLLGKLIRAHQNLNEDNGIKYYITAPNKAASQAAFTSLAQDSNSNCSHALTFIPPEEVLGIVRENDVLVIDEAASLPIGLLIKCSNKLNKLIFASTTHGYEGTGKGFQIRFFKHLSSLTPQKMIEHHTLTTPVRYSANDPLENWLFDAFCLNSEPAGLEMDATKISQPHVRAISQQQLSQNNQLLEEVFGLLIQAHYQTRPSDLRDILDAKGFKIFGLFNQPETNTQNTLLAICLLASEGPIRNSSTNPTIQEDILNGLRRPKGHLTPQVLTHHMGLQEALKLKGARIIRIATLPNLQQQNLGSTLLSAIKEQLSGQQYDYLGSSYANTEDVSGFWQKNGYSCVRIGSKLDSASGTHSALVIKGLSREGITLEQEARNAFIESQKDIKLRSDLTELEDSVLNSFLVHRGSYETAKQILSRFDNWPLPFPKKANAEFKQRVFNWLEEQK
ncbi:MAG: GNAT family N-acetyltransferase [Bermanella sp.]